MITFATLGALLPAFSILFASAGASIQEPLCSAPGWALDEQLQQESVQAKAQEIRSAIAELGSEQREVRAAAQRKLRDWGERAIPLLEEAARTSKDPEVRWSARKMIRSIQGETNAGSGAHTKRLERVEKDQEEPQRGSDPKVQEERVQRSSSFQTDADGRVRLEITEQKDGHKKTRVYSADSLEELKKKFPGVLDEAGIKLEIQREGDRREENRARGLDPLLPWKDFEDLRDLLGPGHTGQMDRSLRRLLEEMRAGRLPRRGLWPDRDDKADEGERGEPRLPRFDDLPAAPPPGERLGVTIEPVHEKVAEYLDLEVGVGLMVHDVVDGSLAERLGVHPRDILLEIDGRTIHSSADIRAALRARGEGQEVKLEVLRFGAGRLVLKARKPALERKENESHGDKAKIRQLRRQKG